MPYRELAEIASPITVNEEMEAACRFLKRWERYDPVIAGGALWSWAAGKRARDIDIFAKKTFFSERKAKREAIGSFSDSLPYRKYWVDTYSLGLDRVEVTRYVYDSAETGILTPIDLVLSPWKGLKVIEHFDFEHCSVGFGAMGCSTIGARYYAKGLLEYRFGVGRGMETVKKKTHPELWGNPLAEDALEKVMRKLSSIYHFNCNLYYSETEV